MVARRDRRVDRVLSGPIVGVRFDDLLWTPRALGFAWRRRGSHVVLTHPRMPRPVSVQDREGLVKPYQLRQFRDAVSGYDVGER